MQRTSPSIRLAVAELALRAPAAAPRELVEVDLPELPPLVVAGKPPRPALDALGDDGGPARRSPARSLGRAGRDCRSTATARLAAAAPPGRRC